MMSEKECKDYLPIERNRRQIAYDCDGCISFTNICANANYQFDDFGYCSGFKKVNTVRERCNSCTHCTIDVGEAFCIAPKKLETT